MVAVASSEARHRSDRLWTGPRISMRATTGHGLSTAARRHVTAMLGRLKYAGLPRRLLNLVPSLALADETKKAWSSAGCRCHGVRVYEASHNLTLQPMYQDVPCVCSAADAGLDIHFSVCFRSQQRCPQNTGRVKQRNRKEVADADVVIAPDDSVHQLLGRQPELRDGVD